MNATHTVLVVDDEPSLVDAVATALRYEGFEPRPAGVRAMLPHVDAFLPAHNIESLVDLARALSGTPQRAEHPRVAA